MATARMDVSSFVGKLLEGGGTAPRRQSSLAALALQARSSSPGSWDSPGRRYSCRCCGGSRTTRPSTWDEQLRPQPRGARASRVVKSPSLSGIVPRLEHPSGIGRARRTDARST
jgi:hypothetical protein